MPSQQKVSTWFSKALHSLLLRSLYYFLPALSVFETPRSLPRSIGKSVLGEGMEFPHLLAAARRNHDGSSTKVNNFAPYSSIYGAYCYTERSANVAFPTQEWSFNGPSARSIEVNCKEAFKSTKKYARLVTL